MSERDALPPVLLTHRQYLAHYLKEPRVRLYLALAFGATVATLLLLDPTAGLGAAATLLVAPFVEYGIHRFVFHNRLFYRFKASSDFWKHMHYDHHREPENPDGVFGPAEMMIPFAVAVTLPLGWLAGGVAGCAGAVTTGLWVIVIYEYFHGAAHLLAAPPTAYGRWLKRVHALHHFHNERGNYGVTTPICDFLFGTYYGGPAGIPRSATVRNLGYTEEEAERYPWVRRLSEAGASSRR